MYGSNARLGDTEHNVRVVRLIFGERLGKHGFQKARIIVLMHLSGDPERAREPFAGGEQHGRYPGANDVASRFRVVRVAVGPKARQTRVIAEKNDADHASMEVISTLV